jgi:uncharacterized protein YodC (DUF2158 family)
MHSEGDVVYLKSGSPPMTILEINGLGKAKVGYFSGNDVWRIDHIPLVCLTRWPIKVKP